MTVTEVKGGDDLSEEPPCFLGGQTTLLDEVIKELPTTHVLQHEIQVLPVLVHVVEGEDVLVLDQLHDGDLPLDLLQHRLAEFLLVDYLDGHLLADDAVCSQFYQT